MKKGILSLICFLLLISAGSSLIAQTESNSVSDSLVFSGQLSIWSHYNPSNTLSLSAGACNISFLFDQEIPEHLFTKASLK
ncbi:MAG: hypothetical protein ACOYN5_15355 [Bacteroidales bacterium]